MLDAGNDVSTAAAALYSVLDIILWLLLTEAASILLAVGATDWMVLMAWACCACGPVVSAETMAENDAFTPAVWSKLAGKPELEVLPAIEDSEWVEEVLDTEEAESSEVFAEKEVETFMMVDFSWAPDAAGS